ncbi:Enamine deaminase RidA, house cleaning of reactive enamine intermediates, YjgF/YER057c/UK114 family [Cnuella takakiae]|uniref:Enamine deaminase RidA, house cleaning of reactive enamine intermediates, YjgF/YER057c/UK114 family n=1 Tax=Cnuella takakiae TaxID=1302690 RepID=A0A1M5B0J2_9BACT|nr:RidA family protein [Cnuella takakiae]OLY93291.1 hypothetical protein BUE76_16405 [Cnuella takakiae]SHF35973.1 Enamine deaminase RidA, house cleaning of reactive enamine intermediates, YjgF/YER057c/UK114 family [Cnuella takakiae]
MEQLSPEQRLQALGLVLPPPPPPLGVYKPCLVDGNYVYVSGHGTLQSDGSYIIGRVGYNMDKDVAQMAARQVGLAILSTLRQHLGSLDKIEQVIKVLGMVAAEPHFEEHPFVINGCSELFAQVWGPDMGVGVRSAIGVGSLPGNIPVEIEALFRLRAGA